VIDRWPFIGSGWHPVASNKFSHLLLDVVNIGDRLLQVVTPVMDAEQEIDLHGGLCPVCRWTRSTSGRPGVLPVIGKEPSIRPRRDDGHEEGPEDTSCE